MWRADDNNQEALLREFYRKWPEEAKARADFERKRIEASITAKNLELVAASEHGFRVQEFKQIALDAVSSNKGTGKETPQVRKRPRV